MENKMFCFQCEQTAGCTGKAGVCGKSADTAKLQDQLTGALIGLARATDGNTAPTDSTWKTILKGLFTTVTNVNSNNETIRAVIHEVHSEREKLIPQCRSCGAWRPMPTMPWYLAIQMKNFDH